jgi:hypothetical protein
MKVTIELTGVQLKILRTFFMKRRDQLKAEIKTANSAKDSKERQRQYDLHNNTMNEIQLKLDDANNQLP